MHFYFYKRKKTVDWCLSFWPVMLTLKTLWEVFKPSTLLVWGRSHPRYHLTVANSKLVRYVCLLLDSCVITCLLLFLPALWHPHGAGAVINTLILKLYRSFITVQWHHLVDCYSAGMSHRELLHTFGHTNTLNAFFVNSSLWRRTRQRDCCRFGIVMSLFKSEALWRTW